YVSSLFVHTPATPSNIFTLSLHDALPILAASLNKYGTVNLEYMKGLIDKTEDALLDDLKGRVFFNPLIRSYEIADKFIAGNVISDRKSTRLNSSHVSISYAVFCLKKKTNY